MLLLHRRRGEEPYFSLRHIIPYNETSPLNEMFGSLVYIVLIINIHKPDIILSYSLLFGSRSDVGNCVYYHFSTRVVVVWQSSESR